METKQKKVKNLYIRTLKEFKDELITQLGDIPYKIQKGDGKGNIYEGIINTFGLFPFNEPDNYKDGNLKFVIDYKYFDEVKSIDGIEKTTGSSFRYKNDKLNLDITYNITKFQKPKYPIYVVSYGRYDLREHTIDSLEEMGVDYYICVQEREKELYENSKKEYGWNGTIITSPNTNDGSSLQRNTCWEHSKKNGFKKFWLLDDNMTGWYYFNMLEKVKIKNPYVFTHLEDVMDNTIEPVGIVSHCYNFDVRMNELRNPFQINTKNYSSCLIDTEICGDIRFRLKYNEDIDLTLQVLERGIKTLGFNIFLSGKKATKTIKGGNTDSIYKDNTSNEDKMLDKYLCLYNTWENSVIKPYIKQTNSQHTDGRTHHKISWDNISKVFNNEKVITPKIKKKKLNFEDLGIKMIVNK
jgi:hypothetical protein